MIKIMHLADLHLDSPFTSLSYSESVKRRGELREVFSSAVDKAIAEGISVVLLSGDLFDGEYFTRDTLEFLFACFEKAKNVRFVISPGNHDPYRAKSPYKEFEFEENLKRTENVFVFKDEKITSFEFPDISLTVYGWAFTSASRSDDPLENFRASGGGFHVLCAHADTESPLSTYAPVKESSLAASGLDYAALGHIHTKDGFMRAGNTVYAYSGALSGRDFSEYGDKGGIIVTLDEKDGGHEISLKRIKLCPWTYNTVEIDVSGTSSTDGLLEKIKGCLDKKEGNIVRIVLVGRCSYEPDGLTIVKELSEMGVTMVENKVRREYERSGLKDEFGIRGEFYRRLLPLLESDDEQVRQRAETALRFGLSALDGEEIKY